MLRSLHDRWVQTVSFSQYFVLQRHSKKFQKKKIRKEKNRKEMKRLGLVASI